MKLAESVKLFITHALHCRTQMQDQRIRSVMFEYRIQGFSSFPVSCGVSQSQSYHRGSIVPPFQGLPLSPTSEGSEGELSATVRVHALHAAWRPPSLRLDSEHHKFRQTLRRHRRAGRVAEEFLQLAPGPGGNADIRVRAESRHACTARFSRDSRSFQIDRIPEGHDPVSCVRVVSDPPMRRSTLSASQART